MNFKEAAKGITIVDVLLTLGYKHDISAGNKYPRFVHPETKEKICIINPTSDSPGFFNQANTTDKGSLYTFIETRIQNGMINHTKATVYDSIIAFLSTVNSSNVHQKDSLYKHTAVNEVPYTHNKSDLLPLNQPAYLYSRKIFIKDLNGPEFKNKIFNDANYITNIAFPLYAPDDSIVGIELNNAGFKKKVAGSNRTNSLWKSNVTSVPLTNIIVTENPIDAISFHILQNYPEGNIYVSTAGALAPGQIGHIIEIWSENNGTTIQLSFDNDTAGFMDDIIFFEYIFAKQDVKLTHIYNKETNEVSFWLQDRDPDTLDKIANCLKLPVNNFEIKSTCTPEQLPAILRTLSYIYHLKITIVKSNNKDFNDDLKILRTHSMTKS
jgi:hypothetical protein